MDEVAGPCKPRKQKQLGPAPIASFEDTSSDSEMKFKMELNKPDSQLTDIVEQDSPNKKCLSETIGSSGTMKASAAIAGATRGLRVHSTPRIDISRASSSSQHEDSRDSSPENVFDQVGTGTLQEAAATSSDLGFVEDGATDLRSSTEELFFTDVGDKAMQSKTETDAQQTRPSPVLFRFDEQQQACLQQNQRKDSASSEVAALLCISGRTSRISSVGSQGSAVSRLSAISGVSRSPSPHKMILETSFCGPKPINSDTISGHTIDSITAEELEHVILARKHDVTKAVFAEGIQIDTSTPKKTRTDPAKHVTNGSVRDASIAMATTSEKAAIKRAPGPSSAARAIVAKKTNAGVLKKTDRTIVGVTPEGTQYIRIKLKPDHLYEDHGIGANERVVDESESAKKPATLSLGRDTAKKAAPHFSQLVQADSHAAAKQSSEHLTSNLSPKPSRHSALRATGSRSPSPATVSVSRKSSFCSLFKSKDVVASPESPTTGGQRKKSAISILLDSPRDRSRSKSRESDRSSGAGGGGPSANSTPSKQRSVLAIFKPKRSSKSSSPVDPEMLTTDSDTHRSRKNANAAATAVATAPKRDYSNSHHQKIESDKPRLRYYDTPTDGASIYIPLHTPPDEKENAASFVAPAVAKPKSAPLPAANSTQSVPTAKAKPSAVAAAVSNERDVRPSSAPVSSTAKPQMKKSYRIELPDGSIRIPLRTPSDERTEAAAAAAPPPQPEPVETVQPKQSMRPKELSQSDQSTDDGTARVVQEQVVVEMNIEPRMSSSFVTAAIAPTPEHEQQTAIVSAAVPKQSSQEEQPANGTVAPAALRTMTKERKRILFSTKIGSGSEEQIFATQLSLSKTESLSSQLSEQVSCNLESPSAERDEKKRADAEAPPIAVKMRQHKDDSIGSESRAPSEPAAMNVNRHSMYIENIDEIMETQKRIDIERKSSLIGDVRMTVAEETEAIADREPALHQPPPKATPPEKPERLSKTSPTPRGSKRDVSEEKTAVSSESDHESEFDSKHRLPRPIGNVEEESTGLVAQDSYDDELPYIPTTLPEERALGVTIVPVRDRALMEVRTCPVDRPRSTTPLNPSFLEEYCGTVALTDDMIEPPLRGEKLRISLPRKEIRDACGGQRSKSPRRISNSSGKSWFEFAAEQGIGGQTVCSPSNSHGGAGIVSCSERKGSAQSASEWIDFDSIPEKRKPAKRITTLPQKDSPKDMANVQYNYVNPEECQCECHGNERESGNNTDSDRKESVGDDQSPDDCVPLLDSDHDEVAAAGNRNSQAEQSLIAFDCPEDMATNSSRSLHDRFKQQFSSEEIIDVSQKRTSVDSTGSQSPRSRSSKTTTVQLPQRLQR